MITEQINTLLAQPNHAVVATSRANGAPQLSVVWYLWEEGSFFFSTTSERAKYRNIVRDPAISFLVNAEEEGWYMVAYGRAEIIKQTAEFTRRLYAKYRPDLEYDGQVDPNRVVVILRPEKVLTGS